MDKENIKRVNIWGDRRPRWENPILPVYSGNQVACLGRYGSWGLQLETRDCGAAMNVETREDSNA